VPGLVEGMLGGLAQHAVLIDIGWTPSTGHLRRYV
jgi:hypothetical protein